MTSSIRAILLAAVLMFAGCSSEPPRFDATSKETIKSSVANMTAGMTEEEKKQFSVDMATITMLNGMQGIFKGQNPKSEVDLFKPLNGMTLEEIRTEAQTIRGGKQEQSK